MKASEIEAGNGHDRLGRIPDSGTFFGDFGDQLVDDNECVAAGGTGRSHGTGEIDGDPHMERTGDIDIANKCLQ